MLATVGAPAPRAAGHSRSNPSCAGASPHPEAVVTVDDNVVVRTHAHIVGLVEEARLPERVARRALATFAALADVEARLHRRPVDQVHFHEVGGHDTIIDVVGTAAALEVLGIDEIRASPVATGLGMVQDRPRHASQSGTGGGGPARRGADLGTIRCRRTDHADRRGPACRPRLGIRPDASDEGDRPGLRSRLPASSKSCPTARKWSSGCGSTDSTGAELGGMPATPVAAESAVVIVADGDADAGQPVAHLEANVDDATGEQLAHAVSVLLEAGAHDAWLAPVVMKKGRPGSVVHVLCDPSDASVVPSPSCGSPPARWASGPPSGERWPVARSIESVWVDGQMIRIKVSAGRVKAEHEDVAQAARRTGQPLREVAYRAEALWRSSNAGPTGGGIRDADRAERQSDRSVRDRRQALNVAPEPPRDDGNDTA